MTWILLTVAYLLFGAAVSWAVHTFTEVGRDLRDEDFSVGYVALVWPAFAICGALLAVAWLPIKGLVWIIRRLLPK